MATKKKPAVKATKNAKVAGTAKKAVPNKTVAGKVAKKAPVKAVKKAAPSKKSAVKPAKKVAPAKNAPVASKKSPVKAVPKTAKPAKKATKAASAKKVVTTAKKAVLAKDTKVKTSKIVNKKTSKTVSAPSGPTKKTVAPASKVASAKAATGKAAVPAAKEAPVKKVSSAKTPVASKTEQVKKATPATGEKRTAKPSAKQKVIVAPTTKANAKPVSASTVPNPATRPAITRSAIREEKKANVIVAHRRLENKSKQADESKTMINYQPEFTRSILDQPTENQGPVYRYSDEELNEFKELILGRIEAAKKELSYLQGLITRKDEAGTEDTENRYMNMEDGSGAMEREQLAQLASRQIQFINHLEKALMRIENKTYGICRVTGKLIDKARLRAVPHATLSIEAKKTMSK